MIGLVITCRFEKHGAVHDVRVVIDKDATHLVYNTSLIKYKDFMKLINPKRYRSLCGRNINSNLCD